MLFSLGGGGGLVFWVGTRKERRLTAQGPVFFPFIASGNLTVSLSIAEKMQIEKDALRDKEIQVVSSTRAVS